MINLLDARYEIIDSTKDKGKRAYYNNNMYWYAGIIADSAYEVINSKQGMLQLMKSKFCVLFHI